jgi:hypothetical protein
VVRARTSPIGLALEGLRDPQDGRVRQQVDVLDVQAGQLAPAQACPDEGDEHGSVELGRCLEKPVELLVGQEPHLLQDDLGQSGPATRIAGAHRYRLVLDGGLEH